MRLLEFGQVFEVIYVGEVSNDYRIETMEEVERRLALSFIRKILIDYTSAWPAQEASPQASAARYVERLAEMKHARGARFAFLNAPMIHADLGEAVESAIGCRFRRFYDRTAALEWLKS